MATTSSLVTHNVVSAALHRRRSASASKCRRSIVCRAEMAPEDRERGEDQQQSVAGPSSSQPLFGAGAVPASSREWQWEEQPLAFSPDLNTPPVLVQDWRAFRARLVAMENGQAAQAASLQLGREERWAHVLAQPERGCLLVAQPRPGLGMFTNAVILLLEHDDREGSSGLVINMPTPLLISNLGLEEDIAEAFRQCPLFIGGPVTKNLLHVLHARREVEGALEIIEGVFAGGVESASELVRRGEASPKDFMLLSGYSGWGPWQLQQELRGGTWIPIAASQAVIMECLRESLAWNPQASNTVASRILGSVSPGLAPNSEDVKRQCWQRVLRQAGIEPHTLGLL